MPPELHLPTVARAGAALVAGMREHGWGCRGRARTRLGSSGGCAAGAASCGSVLVGLRLGARRGVLLQRRRIHAARPVLFRRTKTRPHRAGSPVDVPAWVWLVYSGPPARGIVLFRLHPAGSRLARTRTLRRHPCRRSFICRRWRGRGLLLSRGCANMAGDVEGVREHAWGVPGVAAGAASCGSVRVGLRLGARREVLLQRRRIHAARPVLFRRTKTRPHRAGSPVDVLAWVGLVYGGPPGRGIVLFRLHPAGSRLAQAPTLRRHPCRRSLTCRRLRGRRLAYSAPTPAVITRAEPKQAVHIRR